MCRTIPRCRLSWWVPPDSRRVEESTTFRGKSTSRPRNTVQGLVCRRAGPLATGRIRAQPRSGTPHMRLGGRLAAAIDVLEDIERRHRPAADALKDWGLSHRFAGAGDRAAIGNIVYDALRSKRSAGWLLGADTPRALGFGALLLEWNQTPQILNDALEGDKFAPPPLDDDELRIARDAPARRRAARGPRRLPRLVRAAASKQTFGEDWVAEGAALCQPAAARSARQHAEGQPRPRAGRAVGHRRGAGRPGAATASASRRSTAPAAIPTCRPSRPSRRAGSRCRTRARRSPPSLPAPSPGMQVLDYCAGAGGKTLALSAAMENRGQIFAYDSEKVRLAPIFDRIRRSDNRNIQVLSQAAGAGRPCRPDGPGAGRRALHRLAAPGAGARTPNGG